MKRLVLKVLRMRKSMLRNGVSLKNKLRVLSAIKRFETYGEFYPNATDQGYRAVVKRYYAEFLTLMPGKSSKAHDSLFAELENQLNNL